MAPLFCQKEEVIYWQLRRFGAFLVHFFGPQKQEKPPLNVFRRGFWILICGDSRNRIDTAFSPTGLYKSLFYAEEMQV